MKLLVLDRTDVRDLLPMAECIEVMEDALRTLAAGRAVQPLRSVMRLPAGNGLLGLMPAAHADVGVFGFKAVSVMPGNRGTAWDTHLGAVMLFDGERGQPIALLDGTEVTAIRTAAVSAVATRALAREAAGDLALLGSGAQARAHLEAMRAVRELRRVRVWSRSAARAAEFAARESTAGLAVEPVSSPRAAVEGADIVCTVTAATTPVLEGAWLQPGAHVNAVGACVPTARELDTDAVRRAVLVTDRRDSLLAEAGDFLLPLAAGEIDASHLRGELGEVLTGRVRGRSCAAEITLFKSLGIGIEDVAAGWHAYRKAIDRGRGRELAIGDCPPSVEMGPRA